MISWRVRDTVYIAKFRSLPNSHQIRLLACAISIYLFIIHSFLFFHADPIRG